MYNDEIIQIIGGLNDYVGKLDQTPHPMGPGWYRIQDPCLVFLREDVKNKRMTTVVSNFSGPVGQNNYRKFVDVYIPPDCQMEIRVIDKKGKLHEFYQAEITRKAPNLIVVPDRGVSLN